MRSSYNNAETSFKPQWSAARMLWPYLWRYRARVVIGLVFLIAARLANIGVPLILKDLIDQLEQNKELALIAVPIGLIIAYGALRLSSIVFNELRNVVFAKASTAIPAQLLNSVQK